MPVKQRSRAFRREQSKKHRIHKTDPATREHKRSAYDRNKRVALNAALRSGTDWGW